MNEPSSQAGRGLWAVWFVIAALLAQVAVPAYLGRRVAEVQTRITEVLEVAGGLSSRMTVLKSRQMGRVEAFALSGDSLLRDQYLADVAEEDALFAHLSALAEDLDLDVRERLA